jgi:hypothetical protein
MPEQSLALSSTLSLPPLRSPYHSPDSKLGEPPIVSILAVLNEKVGEVPTSNLERAKRHQ